MPLTEANKWLDMCWSGVRTYPSTSARSCINPRVNHEPVMQENCKQEACGYSAPPPCNALQTAGKRITSQDSSFVLHFNKTTGERVRVALEAPVFCVFLTPERAASRACSLVLKTMPVLCLVANSILSLAQNFLSDS